MLQYADVKWIKVAQEGVEWMAFVKTVMNLRVPESKEFPDHLSNYQPYKRDSAPWSC
jgi:hypothetical protein